MYPLLITTTSLWSHFEKQEYEARDWGVVKVSDVLGGKRSAIPEDKRLYKLQDAKKAP